MQLEDRRDSNLLTQCPISQSWRAFFSRLSSPCMIPKSACSHTIFAWGGHFTVKPQEPCRLLREDVAFELDFELLDSSSSQATYGRTCWLKRDRLSVLASTLVAAEKSL
ncbi:hypothetical protein AB1N83_014025 [Pleurotus pulmonarius]